MFHTTVRSVLARSAHLARRSYLLPVRSIGASTLNNAVVAQGRAFSVSSRFAFPAAVKKATSKSKSKTSATKKKSTSRTKTASKRTVKKAAPKKKKAAAKKKPAKKRVKAKKTPVPKPKTPRNDASLRAPPRAVNAFSLYLKQTFPTLQPKPKSAPEGLAQIRVKWTGLSDTEKKRYEEEAQKVTAERRKVYDEWRSKLSLSEVQSINKYRKAHGHSKLGQPGTSKRPLSSWMIFLKRFVASGEVKPPSGEPAAPFYAREAAKRWKALTKAEKDAYKS